MIIGDWNDIPRITTDFTVNGKCSNCGECCTAFLPISNTELKRIKKYVKRHNVRANYNAINTYENPVLDITCPFRNNAENKCDIYEVRPWICQKFTCGDCKHHMAKNVKQDKKVINLREIFR